MNQCLSYIVQSLRRRRADILDVGESTLDVGELTLDVGELTVGEMTHRQNDRNSLLSLNITKLPNGLSIFFLS